MLSDKISIVIASFNKAGFIEQTIQSVISQTYFNWELIIVDDNSNDSTVEVLAKFKDERRIRFFQNPNNKGANYCRNVGIKASEGDYLIFLDADDVLEPWCLETRLKKFAENIDADVCVFSMGVFGADNNSSAQTWEPRSKNPLKDFLRHKLPWSILQPMWRKQTVLNSGGFDENFLRLQDVEFHTRLLLNSNLKVVQFVSEPDCKYRIDDKRKTFSEFEFADRWMSAAVQYCEKFAYLPYQVSKHLIVTLFQSYLSLIYLLKTKKINAEECLKLENKIMSSSVFKKRPLLNRTFFRLAKKINLLPFRIPGLNSFLKNLLA